MPVLGELCIFHDGEYTAVAEGSERKQRKYQRQIIRYLGFALSPPERVPTIPKGPRRLGNANYTLLLVLYAASR